MSYEFEVKPIINKVFDENTNAYRVTVDTGAEDKNRGFLSTSMANDVLGMDINIVMLDKNPNSDTNTPHKTFQTQVNIHSKDNDKASLVHVALYQVDQSLYDEFGQEAIEQEIKDGWFYALSDAILDSAQKHGQMALYDSTAPILPYGQNLAANPTQNFVSERVAMQPLNSAITPMNFKNIPTSWLVIGSSVLTFIATLLVVFLLQGILSSANAVSANKSKSPQNAVATATQSGSSLTAGGAPASSSDLPGINADAMVAVQQQTVNDMLKDMGIDASHNQQDLSCLVQ